MFTPKHTVESITRELIDGLDRGTVILNELPEPKIIVMNVTITIETGNEAMQSRNDIANAIQEAADRFRSTGSCYFPIMDANGNKVGEFNIENPANPLSLSYKG